MLQALIEEIRRANDRYQYALEKWVVDQKNKDLYANTCSKYQYLRGLKQAYFIFTGTEFEEV